MVDSKAKCPYKACKSLHLLIFICTMLIVMFKLMKVHMLKYDYDDDDDDDAADDDDDDDKQQQNNNNNSNTK